MNIILDIMGSLVIGAILLLMIINANIYQSTARFASDSELQLQQNAKTLSDILSYDIRKIGYDCNTNSISEADSERISFLADINRDGSVDVVTYFISDTSYAKATTNPHDRVLMRVVNSDTSAGPSLGLTKLKFTYLDDIGTPTSDINKIEFIRAELWIESNHLVRDEYLFTYWESTINPRNL